jgi:hypothetical protein
MKGRSNMAQTSRTIQNLSISILITGLPVGILLGQRSDFDAWIIGLLFIYSGMFWISALALVTHTWNWREKEKERKKP